MKWFEQTNCSNFGNQQVYNQNTEKEHLAKSKQKSDWVTDIPLYRLGAFLELDENI